VRRGALALGGALLVAGCATDRVTLLDNEDGSAQFAVAEITDPGRECVIDKQLSEQKLGRGCKPKALDKVRDRDATLVQGLPLKVYIKEFRFAPDVAELTPAQLAEIPSIQQAARERSPAQIEIEGFTDSDGPEAANLDLSRKRAQAVAQQLRAGGVQIDESDVIARGEFEALKSGPDETVNPDFRKVSVTVR
jgi:outer membrane protein OmpA-like peptidoglycan-associated protein